MSKKKITAPLSYDPGKGRPKEHLAYLNWQEMQALQRLNGGNMERGPRGLPSFPPADAIGSGQTPGTGNWQGSPGGTTTGGTSPGAQGSGTSTNWGGSNNYGTDPSSWSGSGSNYGGVGSPSSSAASSSASAASSATSSSAASENTNDTAAQQAAAINNAETAARNAALSQDARRAGIGSIEVGPMRTPVSIGGGAISAAVSSGVQQSYAPTPVTQSSLGSTGYYHSFTGALPGMNSPSVFSRTISPSNLVNEYGTPMETWSNAYNPNALTEGAKKIHQAIADQSLRVGVPVDYFSGARSYNPKTGTRQHPAGQAIDIRINDPITGKPVGYTDIGQAAYNPIGSVSKNRSPAQAAQIQEALAGPYRQFATGVLSSFYSNPGVYGDFKNQRWGGSFEGGTYSKDYMHFDEGKASSGVSRDQARLRNEALAMAQSQSMYAANNPSQIPSTTYPSISATVGIDATPAAVNLAGIENTYNPGIIPDPLAVATIGSLTKLPSVLSNVRLPAIPEASTFDKMKRAAASKIDPVKFQQEVNKTMASLTSGFSLPSAISAGISALNQYAPSTTPPAEVQTASVEEDYRDPFAKNIPSTQNYRMLAEEQNFPRPVSPETLDTIEEQQKTNRMFVKGTERIPYAGTVPSIIDKGLKLFTGKDIVDYGTDLKYKYLQSDEAQKAAMRDKYPDVRRFAVSIGDIAPNTGNQYASSGTPTQELGGKTYEERPSPYITYPSRQPEYRSGPYGSGETDLNDQYRLWDLGIGIPEPGDPDYNDYMKYLESRGSSAQV